MDIFIKFQLPGDSEKGVHGLTGEVKVTTSKEAKVVYTALKSAGYSPVANLQKELSFD